MNQSDFRMGWPAALNCIPQEPRKAHVTPPRETNHTRDHFEMFDYKAVHKDKAFHLVRQTECRQVKQSINGAAQAPRSESERWDTLDPTTPEAAPPSTTDKPQAFKVGDRVRMNWPTNGPRHGTVVTEVVGKTLSLKFKSDGHESGNWSPKAFELMEKPPEGVWVKTSERKPPQPGLYKVRILSVWPGMTWTGEDWLQPNGQAIGRDSQGFWEWLDESPQTDADGWITHDRSAKCPVPAGTLIAAIKQEGGSDFISWCPSYAEAFIWSAITAYRIAKAPA